MARRPDSLAETSLRLAMISKGKARDALLRSSEEALQNALARSPAFAPALATHASLLTFRASLQRGASQRETAQQALRSLKQALTSEPLLTAAYRRVQDQAQTLAEP